MERDNGVMIDNDSVKILIQLVIKFKSTLPRN